MGRMKSISSWLSMWQCHTYSSRSPSRVFGTVTACPVSGSNVLIGEPTGMDGSIGRMESGSLNGRTGICGRRATMVSSSGCMRTVSFEPISPGSGAYFAPSQPTRLTSCTSNRWKCTGWLSTPLCVIFQICVPSPRVTDLRADLVRVEDFGGRLGVAEGHRGLHVGVGVGHLRAERGVHPAPGGVELLDDRLGCMPIVTALVPPTGVKVFCVSARLV